VNLFLLLRFLLETLSPWLLRPAVDPEHTLLLWVPRGWSVEYEASGLTATRPDDRAELTLRIVKELSAPPADSELLTLAELPASVVESGPIVHDLNGLYLRRFSYHRSNRYGLLAGLYGAGRLWLWRFEGPWREREQLSALGKLALLGIQPRLTTLLTQRKIDFNSDSPLVYRAGTDFRIALPAHWQLDEYGIADFHAVFDYRGRSVAGIGVLTAGPAAGAADRSLFLESLLLDLEASHPEFTLLSSQPTFTRDFRAQFMRGKYQLEGLPIHLRAAVLFGERGTYSILGDCGEPNRVSFDELFDRVVESLREGSVATWYEELWDFLLGNVISILLPALVALLAGLFFLVRGLWHLLAPRRSS